MIIIISILIIPFYPYYPLMKLKKAVLLYCHHTSAHSLSIKSQGKPTDMGNNNVKTKKQKHTKL